MIPSWSDVGNLWTTLREVNTSAVRAEAERVVSIRCVGDVDSCTQLASLLEGGAERYPAVGVSPLYTLTPPFTGDDEAGIRAADAVVVTVAAPALANPDTARIYSRCTALNDRVLLTVLGSACERDLPAAARARSVILADLHATGAAGSLATALVALLRDEARLAAARRLPALRPAVARELITTVAFANASYAAGTGLAEQLPALGVPFAAADLLVLTKNQALLVYRLALAHGAPPDFAARIREVLPVVGGAFVWRQLARSLVGLIPVWGFIPKVAVAYSGTYATGTAAWAWYGRGHELTPAELRRVSQEALIRGRARAGELVAAARERARSLPQPRRFWRRIRKQRS